MNLVELRALRNRMRTGEVIPTVEQQSEAIRLVEQIENVAIEIADLMDGWTKLLTKQEKLSEKVDKILKGDD